MKVKKFKVNKKDKKRVAFSNSQIKDGEEVLKLINVNKKYKLDNKQSFQALYDINVSFKNGELVSIVGESGSGKSTLMNLIGGLDSDFTGTIFACNESLGKLTSKELDKYRKDKVGFVFQSFNLISHLSILDNVTLALTLSNISEKEKVQRATDMLKLVGLSSQLKKKPSQLSGGQKQRVAIARALINNPDIIIADEPTGALDTTTSMQILNILKEIADSGKLVIMVTHSEKVASISSRVVEIMDGRITGDHVNENYQKGEVLLTHTEEKEKSGQDGKKGKTQKQNLSFFSAIRLSLHNMLASKTKNLLMAFGVAIGIGSLLLMLCFSSGITDYIADMMSSYSNPEIVSISKGNSLTSVSQFEESEITDLTADINAYLTENGSTFQVTSENLEYGFGVMTISGTLSATVSYQNVETDRDVTTGIFYLYSTPPYYTKANLITGDMSTESGGIMVSKGLATTLFGGTDLPNDKVTLTIYTSNTQHSEIPIYETVTAVVDSSMMSSMNIVYIDYTLLSTYYERVMEEELLPTTLYIDTQDEAVATLINSYLSTRNDVSGSVEENLTSLFTSMTSTIGTCLIVIAMISLIVSAIMILVVMYMSVTERTKEIGVLKSIGAREKDIRRIFTSESFLVGLLSGVCGLLLGGVLFGIIYICLNSIIGIAPLSFKWYYAFIALGVSVVISIISGLYPASKAAKLDPVESLRRE